MPYRSVPRACSLSQRFPLARSRVRVIGKRSRISPQGGTCGSLLQVEDLLDQPRHVLRPKRSQRHSQVQTRRGSARRGAARSALSTAPCVIFAVRQPRRNVNLPVRERPRTKESIHSLMPASPVLISCPPPTRQTITPQSRCRSRQEIRNSGSERLKSGCVFLAEHEAGCLLQVPCALRLVEEGDMLDRRPGGIDQALIPEVVDVLDEGLFTRLLASPFLSLPPRSFSTRTRSRARGLAQDVNQRAVAGEENACTDRCSCRCDSWRYSGRPASCLRREHR